MLLSLDKMVEFHRRGEAVLHEKQQGPSTLTELLDDIILYHRSLAPYIASLQAFKQCYERGRLYSSTEGGFHTYHQLIIRMERSYRR
jgi:hypothetical protein